MLSNFRLVILFLQGISHKSLIQCETIRATVVKAEMYLVNLMAGSNQLAIDAK